ncbi:E3 ubiquitin-protein ligase SINA-like 5 [Exaiptasia diaphana]|uniref:Uncharacterized protein n=1 Tax=Exaiptasia diaphana TaxID=2652724 RepID=A0A913Y8K6_EXADI|nr:E3 ubiquitin-protein ligase SINA-like 5 [Exaiptasia diaphana]
MSYCLIEDEEAQDEDDITDDDASNEDDEEDEVNPMGKPDEDPKKARPRRRRGCCKFPFKSVFGCYRGRCYRCCSACKHKVAFCRRSKGFCLFLRRCRKFGKKLKCIFLRRCYPAKYKCFSVLGCLNRKCRFVRKG